MKSLLTIWMLVILTSIGLTVISGNAMAQQFAHPSDPNDWGKVISDRAQEESMRHSSNPVPQNDAPGTPPQDINREVPRDGVGNVQLNDDEIPKHPAFHAQALCERFGTAAPGCDAIDVTDDPIRDPVAPQGSSLPSLQQMQGQ